MLLTSACNPFAVTLRVSLYLSGPSQRHSLCSCKELGACTAQAHPSKRKQSSICDMQKFYTKIEDRPQVREVVTTFKEHHPIEKVSHPMMHVVLGSS